MLLSVIKGHHGEQTPRQELMEACARAGGPGVSPSKGRRSQSSLLIRRDQETQKDESVSGYRHLCTRRTLKPSDRHIRVL